MLILRTSYVLNHQKSRNLIFTNSSSINSLTKQWMNCSKHRRDFNAFRNQLNRPKNLNYLNVLSKFTKV